MVDFREVSDTTLVGITVSGIIIALYGGFHGWYGPGLTSAIASSGLVIATTLSLITTRETLREERLSREQDAKPLLRITLESISLGSNSLMVENVGNGPARDIDVSVEAIGSNIPKEAINKEIEVSLPTIAAGEQIALSTGVEGVLSPHERHKHSEEDQRAILEPVDDISEEDLQGVEKIVLSGSCRDLLENEHSVNSEYFTKYLEEGMAQYGGEGEIAIELQEIQRSIDNLESSVGGFR